MRVPILFLLLFLPSVAFAQEQWREEIRRIVDNMQWTMSDGEDVEQAMEEMYDMLCDIHENPINMNTATREELERLPFLRPKQVEAICEHLYLYKGMRTLAEFHLIPTIDYECRKLIGLFVYIGKRKDDGFPEIKNIVKYGRHKLTTMAKLPLYDRSGDRNGYLGYKYKHWMRYDFTYHDNVRLGFVASQDAGEPFFANVNKRGYDYYSAYLQLKGLGRVENLIVGRYRPSFGKGLVVSSQWVMGDGVWRTDRGFKVHSSRMTADYLQGVAATVDVGKQIDLSAFVSWRNMDATLNADGTVATILNNGYHRTPAEIARKNNLNETVGGVNVSLDGDFYRLGLTAMYSHYSRRLAPNTNKAYRRHYATGSDFVNVGLDYSVRRGDFLFEGETAMDRNGALATVNILSATIFYDFDVRLHHRFYSHKYNALRGKSVIGGGKVNNDNGVGASVTWQHSDKWKFVACTEYVYHYWPTYQASQSSWETTNMLSAVFTPSEEWTISGRYRFRIRQQDGETKRQLTEKTDHRLRLSAAYNGTSRWSGKTQADMIVTSKTRTDRGIMLSQDISYKPLTGNKSPLTVSAGFKYFHTDAFAASLYAYEPGLPYSFSMPAYYGHGIRYSLTAKANVGKWLQLGAKIGTTNYFNRSTIGSGLQAIDASSMTDVELQAVMKLR